LPAAVSPTIEGTDTMSHKRIAIDFLQNASSGRVQEAYAHAAPNFRHHNPFFAAGAPALAAAMEEAHRKTPNKALDVQRAVEEGDLVVVHSRVERDEGDIAAVHIFRFDGDRIAELWDVAMTIPKDSPNKDGVF
jgi:predicted SnoaL-like aldol condensation-catalyzing enzyme